MQACLTETNLNFFLKFAYFIHKGRKGAVQGRETSARHMPSKLTLVEKDTSRLRVSECQTLNSEDHRPKTEISECSSTTANKIASKEAVLLEALLMFLVHRVGTYQKVLVQEATFILRWAGKTWLHCHQVGAITLQGLPQLSFPYFQ